jgi:hypothetical protein
MGFNQNTIPESVIAEVFEGLKSEEMSLAEQIGYATRVMDIAGTLPVSASITSLAGIPLGGIQEGAMAPENIDGFGSVDYRCLRHIGSDVLLDGIVRSLEAFGYDSLAASARSCRAQAAASIDALLNARLVDAALNETTAAALPYTNPGSTPIQDMFAAQRLCGRGDLAVIGGDVAEALSTHPDFLSQTAYFDAGGVGMGTIVQQMRGLSPSLQTVVVGSTMFRASNPGQALQLNYQFDGTFWVGHSRSLVFVDAGSVSEMGREVRREASILRHTHRADIIRTHVEMGCTITGVI